MTLVEVAVASLLIALLTADPRWRPIALGGAFLLRIGLPAIIGNIGVPGGPHVSTVLIISYAVIWPLASRRVQSNTENNLPRIPILCHLVLGMVALGSVIISEPQSATGSAKGLVLNQIVAPYIFCVLVHNVSRQHESVRQNAARLFASFCVFESLIALAVHFDVIPQPYLSAHSAIDSWVTLGTRQSATLDHPLTLGLFLVAGIPMAAYFRSRVTASLAISVMIVGISLTQSRIAVVGAFFGLAYLLTIGSKILRGRLILLATVAAGYAFLTTTGIIQGLLNRIQDDEGSSRQRAQALHLFADSWRDFKLSGVGLQLAKEYFVSHGLYSSGESAAICYAVGIGIPLTLLYFSLMVWMIGHGIWHGNSLSPASAAAIITFASIQFYSSISTESGAGLILWTTIGLAFATPQTAVRSHLDDIYSRIPGKDRTIVYERNSE